MRSHLLLTVACAGLLPACFNPKGNASEGTSDGSEGTSQGPLTTGVMSTGDTTSAGATSGSGTGSATSDATTGEPDPPRAFRFSSLEFIDPHIFLGSPCTDVTEALNQTGIQEPLSSGEYNVLLAFENFDVGALEPSLLEAESCDLQQDSCKIPPGAKLTIPASRIDSGNCSTLDLGLLSPSNVGSLNSPQPTCFQTSAVELPLPLVGASFPIDLLDAQVVFNFDSLADPQAITNGLIYGFLGRPAAEATSILVTDAEFNLWSLIIGADDPGCAAAYPDQLPSTEFYQGVEGAWVALNFTAESVQIE